MEQIEFQVTVGKDTRFVIPLATNRLLGAKPGDTLNLAVLSIKRKEANNGGVQRSPKIHVHRLVGISDDRATEIVYDVRDTLIRSGRADSGIKQLAEKYDPESLLAGMRVMQLLRHTKKLDQHMQGQNAELN